MKGDFTRGFQPDQSRGKRYRRVLLQQGRVLLDSDHAALVDATDRSLRELAADLGCKAGSPDYGYIVTPGVLRRLFDSLGGITTDANTTARLDYEHRYLDRFPSLYLEGSGASPGVVTIELIANAADPTPLVVWVRSQGETEVGFKRPIDADFDDFVVDSSGFQRVELGFGETDTVQIQLDPGERVWIGMIETQSTAAEPSFSIAAGRYYLGGLVLENPSIAAWPAQAFVTPTDTSFTPLSSLFGGPFTHVLAYVEGWERLHTQHHDPGIREEALGGELDTTVRSEVVGQVKILPLVVAPLSSPPSWDELAAAFAAPFRGDGELDIDIAAEIVDPNPCAVPVDGGYTGRDNRLYRFEVHAADGSLATTRLKWSRDNGSELFPIVSLTGAEVTVAATTDLRDGDLVEVLSEVIELGDEVDAALISGTLIPSKRMVGELAVLVEQEPDSLGRPVFKLGQVDAPDLSITLPAARYGANGADAKLLRRWHGLIDGADGATHEIEDGIGITLSGSVFEVGSWWTYEARTLQQNANGEWKSSPHGPERRFAPLAVFDLPGTVDEPLELNVEPSGWADDRFSSLCSTNADDIPYDGAGVCSDADTVQEALDQLFRKTGCCEVKFSPCHPSQIADDQLIAELIERELPNGGVLCLAAGVYTFENTLDIAALELGGELTIHGCAGTIIQAAGSDPLFQVSNGTSLTLEHLILVNADGGTAVQVEVIGNGSRLVAHDVAFVVNAASGAAIADAHPSIVTPSPTALLSSLSWPNPPVPPSVGVDVELRECTILAGQGLRFNVINRLLIDRCNIRAREAAVSSFWIADARITDSHLSTALNLGADIPSVATLTSHPGDALAIATNMSTLGFGATLTAVTILAGHIVGNRINGITGLFVDRLWTSDILDNHVRTATRGLLINQFYKSQIAGNRIVSQLHGVQINFAARQSILAGNQVAAAGGGGIELCAIVQGSSLALECVEVCDNQVFANTHALHVGPTSNATGVCMDVLISGNTIELTESGSGVAVRLSRFASEFQGPGLSFVGNHVYWASTCVHLRGAGVVVGENRIAMEGGSTSAVVANDAANAVIRGNLIELFSKDENTTGIEAIDSPSVLIRDNHVHQPNDAIELRPLVLESFGESAEVIGNRLTFGKSWVAGGDKLRFVGNQLMGSVEIKSIIHGEISSNYVEGVFDVDDDFPDAFIDSILIHEIQGDWRLCDNRCPNGALRLLPVNDGQAEIAYRAIVTDNFVRILQVGWLADVESPPEPDTNVFEQTRMSTASGSRVLVTENLCGDRILINDYSKGTIRSHNIANVYFANIPLPVSEINQPNVKP